MNGKLSKENSDALESAKKQVVSSSLKILIQRILNEEKLALEEVTKIRNNGEFCSQRYEKYWLDWLIAYCIQFEIVKVQKSDPEKASLIFQHYKSAADAGHSWSCGAMGGYYRDGVFYSKSSGKPVKLMVAGESRSFGQSLYHYTRAADMGDTTAKDAVLNLLKQDSNWWLKEVLAEAREQAHLRADTLALKAGIKVAEDSFKQAQKQIQDQQRQIQDQQRQIQDQQRQIQDQREASKQFVENLAKAQTTAQKLTEDTKKVLEKVNAVKQALQPQTQGQGQPQANGQAQALTAPTAPVASAAPTAPAALAASTAAIHPSYFADPKPSASAPSSAHETGSAKTKADSPNGPFTPLLAAQQQAGAPGSIASASQSQPLAKKDEPPSGGTAAATNKEPSANNEEWTVTKIFKAPYRAVFG